MIQEKSNVIYFEKNLYKDYYQKNIMRDSNNSNDLPMRMTDSSKTTRANPLIFDNNPIQWKESTKSVNDIITFNAKKTNSINKANDIDEVKEKINDNLVTLKRLDLENIKETNEVNNTEKNNNDLNARDSLNTKEPKSGKKVIKKRLKNRNSQHNSEKNAANKFNFPDQEDYERASKDEHNSNSSNEFVLSGMEKINLKNREDDKKDENSSSSKVVNDEVLKQRLDIVERMTYFKNKGPRPTTRIQSKNKIFYHLAIKSDLVALSDNSVQK